MSMPDLPLTPDDVAEIAAILDGTAYDRIDITTARFRLRVARDGQGMTQDWSLADDTLPGTAAVATQAPAAETGLCVHAPLPGTFYRAPAPGAPPFVEPGATVSPDTVVGIIETMKLMNPVHAGVHGVIDAILVDNATMIAKGEALMRLTEPQA
ncbi:acetyl-CoA carboxylase biotin carboxyl carrier protein [Novosphingobium acidiphilum]|jgi:biotin carboxyl carrier protein|uniref:acetyl-CoA carboxylase biotin carboxyl carrier protein n=1 Tax=Novosphingobium acidiphilum TaxID=505248 RepID=UPI000410F9EC|nr:biotin/lipoyl-containing protein [Novosphingobium acidiphilum]